VCRHRQSLKKSENQASDAPYTLGERKNPDVHSAQQFYCSNIFSKWYYKVVAFAVVQQYLKQEYLLDLPG
jgi:hypothetical protein